MNAKTSSNFSRREFIRIAAAATAALSVDWARVKALAAAIEPKKDFPVVVIGGGLGGLSAAAHLAQNGFPVTLIGTSSTNTNCCVATKFATFPVGIVTVYPLN